MLVNILRRSVVYTGIVETDMIMINGWSNYWTQVKYQCTWLIWLERNTCKVQYIRRILFQEKCHFSVIILPATICRLSSSSQKLYIKRIKLSNKSYHVFPIVSLIFKSWLPVCHFINPQWCSLSPWHGQIQSSESSSYWFYTPKIKRQHICVSHISCSL